MRARLYIILMIIALLFALQFAWNRTLAHAGYTDNNVVDNTIRKTMDKLHFQDNFKGDDSIK